jgi:hypothetical protein
VYYGRREWDYRTEAPDNCDIPGLGNPVKVYEKLLDEGELLLAEDARRIYGGR